jgi:CRP-like cAMP-binding protein
MHSTIESLLRTAFQNIQPISVEALAAVAAITYEVTVAKNHDLQPMGHTCKTIYFVKSGLARIYYFKDGNDVTEYFAFENDIIVRAESLFSGKPSKKAIHAVEDSVFLAIPAEPLFKLFDAHQDLERLFRKMMEAAYVETVNRMESLQFHSAEERYLDLLRTKPTFIQRIPLKHIASYLGITQVSLSRIRAAVQ